MTAAEDFDFLHGAWTVQHRRLQGRLVGSTDWQEFGGTCQCWPVLGGAGNVDDNLLHLPGGDYRAATIRSFDPASAQWSIWWLDARNPHQLDVPVVGSFKDGIGAFLARDTLDGKPILVQFIWTQDAAGPRWQQAFSPDNGLSWEVNWVMDFRRSAG